MQKFFAVLAIALGVLLIGVLGWGLIYLPAEMSAAAKAAIDDFKLVLERDAPQLTLTHGAISADPLTASVTVADASLVHASGDTVEAEALEFTVDPFSGEISAVGARALGFEKGDKQLKLAGMEVTGLTPATRRLLAEAAQGGLDAGAFFRRLALTRLRIHGLAVTTPNEGEMTLVEITLRNMQGGIVERLTLDGFNMEVRSGRDPGEFALAHMEFTGLNLGEIVSAVSRLDRLPYFTAPVVQGFAMDGFELRTQDFEFRLAKAYGEASYVSNGKGGHYANRSSFAMEGILVKPGANSRQGQEMLRALGRSDLKARIKAVGTSDHSARTMAMTEFTIDLEDLARFDFAAEIGNVPTEMYVLSVRLEDMQALMTKGLGATINSASMVIRNSGLIQHALDQAARKQGIDAKAMIGAMLAQGREVGRRNNDAVLLRLLDQIAAFLADPKVLKITITPKPPLALGRFRQLASPGNPGALLRALNLTAEANR